MASVAWSVHTLLCDKGKEAVLERSGECAETQHAARPDWTLLCLHLQSFQRMELCQCQCQGEPIEPTTHLTRRGGAVETTIVEKESE